MFNQQLNNYKIISLLGEGGMAFVYLAHDNKFDTEVAIKNLKKEFVHNENIRKRFLAEAKNMFKMSHPNIIKVTDLIDAGDIVAFVMEHVAGDSLEDYISKNAPLANVVIENLFNQMIDAIEYVHSQGLIHRDIKPSNFMVTQEGSIKLLDFGIAKNLNDGAVDYTKTSMAQQMGTPMYMSPEQVRNTAEITEKSDIYSLGVVLWQMVMNKKPYNSEVLTLPEIQVAIMKEPLSLTNTDWDEVIEQATEKDPTKRSIVPFDNNWVHKVQPITEKENLNSKESKTAKKRNRYIIAAVLLLILIAGLTSIFTNNEKPENLISATSDDSVSEVVVSPEEADEKSTIKDSSQQVKLDSIEQPEIKEINDIRIGKQIWMVKNLDVTSFRDGTKLFHAKTSVDWINSSKNKIPAYTEVVVRGNRLKLYNGYVVHSNKEIAPVGYHVPNVTEWTALIDFCGGESVAGDNLTSKKYRGKDKVGFNAIPTGSFHVFHQWNNDVEEVSGGSRDYQGSSLWWTSETRVDNFDNSLRPYFVSAKDGFIWWGTHYYGYGCAIRLVKNN
jgi:uncharacterized protein (TIGR02145 family)